MAFRKAFALSKIIFNVSTDVFYGTEQRKTISTYNLSDEQGKTVQNLTTAFRNHNIAVKKNLSAEQYTLLGQIVADFSMYDKTPLFN